MSANITRSHIPVPVVLRGVCHAPKRTKSGAHCVGWRRPSFSTSTLNTKLNWDNGFELGSGFLLQMSWNDFFGANELKDTHLKLSTPGNLSYMSWAVTRTRQAERVSRTHIILLCTLLVMLDIGDKLYNLDSTHVKSVSEGLVSLYHPFARFHARSTLDLARGYELQLLFYGLLRQEIEQSCEHSNSRRSRSQLRGHRTWK